MVEKITGMQYIEAVFLAQRGGLSVVDGYWLIVGEWMRMYRLVRGQRSGIFRLMQSKFSIEEITAGAL